MENKTAYQFCESHSLMDDYGKVDETVIEAIQEYARQVAIQVRQECANEAKKSHLSTMDEYIAVLNTNIEKFIK